MQQLQSVYKRLKTKTNPNYIGTFSSYRAVNTISLVYKNLPVNVL